MDFPLFHLDFMGDRLLIAIIAVVHVMINHALAVGFIPIVTWFEFRGYNESKTNPEEGKKWDELARKFMFVSFVITTSIGALTGVGIWFSVALISPNGIGSLIRVFFGAWFTEWIVFVLEVIFVMIYFLTWKSSRKSEKAKFKHIVAGAALSVFSWLTMAIIVGILGYMMDTGSWVGNKTLIDGFFNPIYLPQLLFRTPLAFVMAGSVALLLTVLYLKEKTEFRSKVFKNISIWMFLWTPHVLSAGVFYYYKIPDLMVGNIPVAVATQRFQNWYDYLVYFLIATIIVSMLAAIWAGLAPKRTSKTLLIIPIAATLLTIGWFERIREFIRKPYVIEEYMYSNLIRVEDYPLFKEEGVLKHSTYVSTNEITEENKLEAGKNAFLITCSRCHTTNNANSIVYKFEKLFMKEEQKLDKQEILNYVPVMHKGRYYMPPFPGNEKELDALADYIIDLQNNPQRLEGAQSAGVSISPVSTHLKTTSE
ncbi:MAG: cytochrome c [Ignavibacteria bacterium]